MSGESPEVAGDLDAGREVIKFSTQRVHLPEHSNVCDTARAGTDSGGRRYAAGVLFDETPICEICKQAERNGQSDGQQPPTIEVGNDVD